MTCKPIKNEKVRTKAFFITAGGVLIWMLSGLGLPGAAAIQLVSIVVLVIGLQYLTRFALSDYSYTIDDLDDGTSELHIYKTQGRRTSRVALVELSSVTDFFPRELNPDYRKSRPEIKNRFNYCQNPSKSVQWILLFNDGERVLEVIFEPDEPFRRELFRRIAPEEINEENFVNSVDKSE